MHKSYNLLVVMFALLISFLGGIAIPIIIQYTTGDFRSSYSQYMEALLLISVSIVVGLFMGELGKTLGAVRLQPSLLPIYYFLNSASSFAGFLVGVYLLTIPM